MTTYLLKKEVEKIRLQVLLDSKSTLFEVINNFKLGTHNADYIIESKVIYYPE